MGAQGSRTDPHNYGNRAAGHGVQPAVAVVLVPTGELEISPSMTPGRPFQEQNFQHCSSTRKVWALWLGENGGKKEEFGITTVFQVRISEVRLKMGPCRT